MSKTALLIPWLIACCPVLASDGDELFEADGCGACHEPRLDRTDAGLGPSLSQIADAYRRRPDQMFGLLRGDGEPRPYSDKYPLMKARLPRVMALRDADLLSLASYVLGF